MSQKTVWLPEIGELVLSKRRGTKNIRLSISPTGQTKVGLPAWAPYSVGISFAKSRIDWIKKHKLPHSTAVLSNGSPIGKSNRMHYIHDPARSTTATRLAPGAIKITTNLPFSDPAVQKKSAQAAEKALKKEAQTLLPLRLAALAAKHGFSYKSVHIKKLSSRWGSCSSDKAIALNYFLMQLPWQLIDYVLLHELVHTVHLNHSPSFWADFEKIYPGAKQIRKQMKNYRPVINSLGAV
jgi:predicted metal-dependent hydrolase